MKRLFFIGLCLVFFGTSFTAFAEDDAWKFGGLAVLKSNVNPWILARADLPAVITGLNAGVELGATYGPLGLVVGYQFMGIASKAESVLDDISSLDIFLAPMDHLVTTTALFAWHKGFIRPYFGLGAAFTFKSKSLAQQISDALDSNFDVTPTIGLVSQLGLDFYLIDMLGLGIGIDLIIQDFRDLETDYEKTLQEATYVSARLVFNF